MSDGYDESTTAESHATDENGYIDRREYLRYTGALAGASVVAGTGVQTAAAGGSGPTENGSIAPADLRVEYAEEPNTVLPADGDSDDGELEDLRFSWEVAGPRGVAQSAYRIRVAEESTPLESGEDLVWDSGVVESTQSTHVPYDGEPLKADTTYYWSVRLWDGDEASDWSEATRFVTALPDDEHWEGEWIGPDYGEWDEDDPIDYDFLEEGDYDDRPEPLLRREFDLERDVVEARIHISGLGCYELYINGERVGDRVLDPAQTQYNERALYSTYDVTEHVNEGRNAIATALGRLRFGEMVADNGDWRWSHAPWWSDPQLLVQLNVEFADGTSASIVTDNDWRMTDGPTRFDSLFAGEVYDAREEKPGWTEPDYDDGDWETAPTADDPGVDLTPQHVQPMRVRNTLDPIEITEPEDGVYVFDFGQVMTGWAELTVEGDAGTGVTVSYGEKLNDDGTVDNSNFLVAAPMQRDHYILGGDGTEQWEPSYSYKGFRYVQIEGYPGEPEPDALEAKHIYTAFDEDVESGFESSNDLFNQLHENTLWAYRNNMQGLPTDTPKYEKNGWTGDAQLTAETGIYNYDMARFWKKWLRDFADAQRDDGETPTVVPNNTEYSFVDFQPNFDAVQGPTPGWDAAFILIPWWVYQYYGDERILETHYENWTQYIEWIQLWSEGDILEDLPESVSDQEEVIRAFEDSHVLPVGLGDWGGAPLTDTDDGYGGGGDEVPISSTAYYYRFTQVLAETASLIGRDEEAAEWDALAEEIREDFNDEFLDTERGYYRTGQHEAYLQTSNLLPLAFDMVPEEYEDVVVENLVENVMETHDGHLNTATLGSKYILPVLTEHGHHDAAYTVATQTDYPSWGHWIANGRTSLLEFWELDSRSWNHHFLGVTDEWFYKHLAGIQVGEPGFEHVRIAPKPAGDLEWASGKTDTVRGVVESSWELVESPGKGRDGQGIRLDVTIPGNATATVEIPTLGGEKVRVCESGTNVWNNGHRTKQDHPGIESIERTDEAVVVEVASGEYGFELERIGN
ncbi:family 78 glycoside hydrolase catalytic domain [Haloterrigena salinisoli]|uniref:family 78 glycoside hydrolase catalytic domain n=1 Tax=Haloterrigena salinisoli TaxID=3132747 RepID=UPI0030D579C6